MSLQDLLARAGASDEDREAWLAERREGITATEVAKLAKSPGFEAELRRIKAGEETFSGNRHTAWGVAREPVIAEHARGFGLEPEHRVFHAREDSRHLASPDALGEDFDGRLFIGELKTSAHDLDPSGDYYWSTTYAEQMQWQMYVTGADRCLLVWEQHDGHWPEPYTFPVRSSWVDRDEQRILELIELADRFLEGPVMGVEAWQAEYLDAKQDREAAQQRMDRASDALAGLFPEGGSVESPLGKVTVSIPKPGTRFDATAFKAAHPDLHQQFQKATKPGGPRVTVTPVKEEDDE